MKIGLNLQILSNTNAGVGRYARNLAERLVRDDPKNEYVLFGRPDQLTGFSTQRVTVVPTHRVVSSSSRRILWEQLVLPWKHAARNLDLIHYPDHTASLLRRSRPTVITIHDLAFLAYPKTFGPGTHAYKSIAVNRSVALADLIVTDSEATRRECLKLLEVPEEKLRVVPLGVGSEFRPVDDEDVLQETRRRYRLQGEVILYVGTLEPRKNIVRLVRAFDMLRARRRADGLRLLIVGGRGWLFKEIFETVESLGLENAVTFTDYVSEEDLPALYSLARVFVYPSLYEGFGLPPLEAMACGTPVITSNTSSLPEVCGEAALYVDPYEVDDIAWKLGQILDDSSLQASLRQAGLARAARFDWESAAGKMVAVFEEAARL